MNINNKEEYIKSISYISLNYNYWIYCKNTL
jgi:hypothetical protein